MSSRQNRWAEAAAALKVSTIMPTDKARGERDIAGVLLNAAFAVILTAILIFSALMIEPAISGGPRQHTGSILLAALTPIGSLLLLSLLERLTPPAGPRKSIGRWLLHLQINVFLLFTLGLVGALFATVPSALARHFGIGLGLIDLTSSSPNPSQPPRSPSRQELRLRISDLGCSLRYVLCSGER
jgi:hypothetical protein